jgi:hypothetical protein
MYCSSSYLKKGGLYPPHKPKNATLPLQWKCSNTTAASPGRSPSGVCLVLSILVHVFTSFHDNKLFSERIHINLSLYKIQIIIKLKNLKYYALIAITICDCRKINEFPFNIFSLSYINEI